MKRQSPDYDRAVFNYDDLLSRCLGKIELAERVLAKFHSRFDLDIAELEQALRTGDPEMIARVAHRLKGASAGVAASELRAEAAGIEELARRGHLPEIPSRIEELRRNWSRFVESSSQLNSSAVATI